jgi:uncharacterized protein
MKKVLAIFLVSLTGLVLLSQRVLARTYPAPVGHVNDFAQIISEPVKTQLEADLTGFEKNTSNEIAVVTLDSLEGDVIENAAVELFAQWGIGKKEKDNGVLLLIAPNERQLRIEVGYGLEPLLTDSRAGTIIRTIITPKFKENDYDGGITAGVQAIEAVLSKDPSLYDQPEPAPASSKNLGSFIYFGVIILLIYASAFLGRTKRFWPGGIAGIILGILLGLAFSVVVTVFMALMFGLLGLLLDYIFSKNYKARKVRGLPTSWFRSGGGFFSGGGGGGFGGFGGGSSGGGGASGSW